MMPLMPKTARFAKFHAISGQGNQLAERLLHAASLIAEAPGCELWLVHRDDTDADTICVTEMWASREQCDAALTLPGVPENAATVMGLLSGTPELLSTEPLGGARSLAGTTGATAFAILDAPDLSASYGLQDTGESRYVREELGAVQAGLTHYRLRPNRRQGFAHRHAIVEEIYVVLAGSGHIKVDDDLLDLEPLRAVRVAPVSTRELEAGADGLEVLAFGTHVPGDGEMLTDWWPN
jgi:quinol monooxygenase YgiN/mannose-6-phosphate isomerase-like protein (cupin superfamily)